METINQTRSMNYTGDTIDGDVDIDVDTGWGPKRDPLYIVIPITALYVLIFVAGMLGNVSTCVVIARNKSMHTATNYYLFSLAISDVLLLAVGLPPDLYAVWRKYPYVFGEAFCVTQGFAAETSANATVLTITAFTVERYVAICHPFLSHQMSKLSRAVRYIVGVWCVALALAVPQALSFELVYGSGVDECACTVRATIVPHAFAISTLLFFIAPMTLITVLYVLIGLQLHRSTVGPSRGNSVRLKHHRIVSYAPPTSNQQQQPVIVLNGGAINGSNGGGEDIARTTPATGQDEDGRKNFSRNAQATKHVVKMLVAVVVAFFICWAPFHAQRLFAVYSIAQTENTVSAYRVLHYISGILYFLSTAINPFLYHIMSHKFRAAFKDTFKGLLRRKRRTTGSARCYSTLSGRSSQVNSGHSNTDSCSRQSSLRYLEAEMARLHDSKRPLVVSFKRKHLPSARRAKQVTILDAELQLALDNLSEEAMMMQRAPQGAHVEELSPPAEAGFSCIEVHSLEPTHICPVSAGGHRRGPQHHHHHVQYANGHRTRRKRTNAKENKIDGSKLTKSSTMPQIVNEGQDEVQMSTVMSTTSVVSPYRRREERSNSCSHLEFQTIPQSSVMSIYT